MGLCLHPVHYRWMFARVGAYSHSGCYHYRDKRRIIKMIGHNEAALCPKCGRSNYEVLFESVTSIYVKPGTPEKDNPNVTTEFCRCNECGEYFNVEEQG